MGTWQMVMTFISLLVGTAMVLSVLYAYVSQQRFDRIGGSLISVLGAAIVAFAGGAVVSFTAGGEAGAKAALGWDAGRDAGRDDADGLLLAAILSQLQKLESRLPGGNPNMSANVTKALEAQVVAAAGQIGSAPEIKPESAEAVGAECSQEGNGSAASIIARYDALRIAAAAGDANSVGAAAQGLSREIDSNPNAQKCWSAIREKLGVSTAFERNFEKAARLSFALTPMQ